VSARAAAGLALMFMAGACAGDGGKPDLCSIGSGRAAVSSADRAVIGQADPYPADPTLAGREAELNESQAARRSAAWDIVARVLAPVPVAEPGLPAGVTAELPRFATWYGRDDFERIFKKLYEGLGTDGRRMRERFSADAMADAFAWNTEAVQDQIGWGPERYAEYVAAIDEEVELHGVGGHGRVAYSPAAAEHLLASYPDTLRCLAEPAPPAHLGGEAGESVQVVERAAVAACERIDYGPYLVADGGGLVASLTGSGDADLYVRRGAPPSDAGYDCRARGDDSTELCDVAGAGPVYVAVVGHAEASEVELVVDYDEADAAARPACLQGEFPPDAAVVKADWRRAQLGETLPVYDTSPERIADRLAGSAGWGPGDGAADPGPDDIYTLRLADGSVYRLAALHVMTKELRHWSWVTLWWSPEPDADLGADRPEAVRALGGPWASYKMCAATGYREQDPAAGAGGPSWCSNPYLEEGAGNAATNCIGCHQHGGIDVTPEEILGDEGRFPHHGRTRVRDNFATDYSWALHAGDSLGSAIQAEVDYWDASE
jgi:hypothetical protein